MATVLFNLHMSRHIKEFSKPTVGAEPAAIAGYYFDSVPWRPKFEDVRNVLPHRYRAAFDRCGRHGWEFVSDETARLTLTDSRGCYLNTVYAMPHITENR